MRSSGRISASLGSLFQLLVALAFVFSLSAPNLSAQSATARIFGKVTDQQGAVLTGTKITVTNADTQVKSETLTDSEGNYQVLALPIGRYRVLAERQGFTSAVTEIYT